MQYVDFIYNLIQTYQLENLSMYWVLDNTS